MSELTVPRAPTTVGRSATVRFEDPGTGQMAAQFGNRLLEFGTALENDRLDREMSRIKVDMTKDLGQLRLQVEDMGDPDAAGQAWDQGMARIRDSYLTSQGDNGRPRVDPKNRENFGLAFDDLSNSHALALGGRFMALRQSQRAATYYEYTNVASAAAASADPGTRDQLYADYDAETDKQVAAGTLSPEDAAVKKREFRQTTENTGAIGALADDPAGMIEAIDAGEYATLDPETRARYRVSAQAELDRRAAAAAKDAEAKTKERSAQIDKRLGDIINIAGNGRVAVDEAWLNSPEVKGSAKYNEAQAAIALRNEIPGLAMMTLPQLDTLIAEEAKKPLTAPYQADRLKVLQTQRSAAADGWRTDPIAFAKKSGLPVPDLPDFDAANPDAYAEAVAARVTFGLGLKDQGYTKDVAYLDLSEQAAIKKALATTTDPAARAALAGALTGAVLQRKGDPAQIAALAEDPVLSWAGDMLARGVGNQPLAAEMVEGQQALQAKTVALPPINARRAAIAPQIGSVLSAIPGGNDSQAKLMAVADAIYASRVRPTDANEPLDEEAYQQAWHEAFGGTGQFGTSKAAGGIQEVNGALTILDPGIRVADIDDTLMQLQRQIYFERPGTNAVDLSGQSRRWPKSSQDALRGATRTGGLPQIGDQPLTNDDWGNATFVARGPDSYAVILNGDAVADSSNGDEFRFSMKRLLAEYGR